jgi:pyruvate kinase
VQRRAKIIATLGPASFEVERIHQLLVAGVDVVRLNLSHGDPDQHRRTVRSVREAAQALRRHVPILMDLMGPRYRLGAVTGGPWRLRRGDRVTLGPGGGGGGDGVLELPVDEPELLDHLEVGQRVLIDNGLIELRVESVANPATVSAADSTAGKRVVATVVNGGDVSTRKGINIPDSNPPFAVSPKDRADITLAVTEGVDYLAASYVGSAEDVAAVREAISEAGGTLPIVAKLERGRAVDNLEAIAATADALMVARGDLGVEVPLHQVPVLQKRIVAAGRRFGKPVVVATQMLESMMLQPRPTRAEASDVANAVFDGADALMLSGETASGDHPVSAVETMERIICAAEAYEGQATAAAESTEEGRTPPPPPGSREIDGMGRDGAFETADVIAAAAVFAARHLHARQIVAFSQGGFTARMIARYRPAATIWAFTNDEAIARRSQLLWGVRPRVVTTEGVEHLDQVVRLVEEDLRSAQLAEEGERIVILMGDPISERPLTNLLRVHQL